MGSDWRSQGRVDWREARHYLNGRLERVEDPMEKGLAAPIASDNSHEEARIYLAFVYAQKGKRLKAASLYRERSSIASYPHLPHVS